MKVKEFLTVLKANPGKELLFEYAENQFAGTNYHLTEVKNVDFKTVDCGGSSNDWQETHLQLWESPEEIGKEKYLMTDKAMAILERVDGIRPLWLDTELKVEFGNSHFHTAVQALGTIGLSNDKVTVKLSADQTTCKAQEECVVAVGEDHKSNNEACAPGSGCC